MEDVPAPAAPARSSPVRGLVIFALVCFAVGIVVMGWLLSEWPPARNLLLGAPPISAPTTSAVPAAQHAAPPSPSVVTPVTPDAQMTHIEEQLAIIDQQASSASDDAARTERMMIAFAARRAIERGSPLGYLEGALTRQFGAQDAKAVSTIVKCARAPVTLERLEEGLDAARDTLLSDDRASNWFGRIWNDVGNLATIRHDGEDTSSPDQHFNRARRALERDRVEMAIREVEAMPGKAGVRPWLDSAQRYVQVRRALDRLEAITLATSHPKAT